MRGRQVFPNACAGDHTAVANQHHIGETELLAQLMDLGGDGLGIGGVAGKYFDRDWTSGSVGEQAKDDLPFTRLVVPRVTEFGQRTVAAFKVSGSQVIKH